MRVGLRRGEAPPGGSLPRLAPLGLGSSPKAKAWPLCIFHRANVLYPQRMSKEGLCLCRWRPRVSTQDLRRLEALQGPPLREEDPGHSRCLSQPEAGPSTQEPPDRMFASGAQPSRLLPHAGSSSPGPARPHPLLLCRTPGGNSGRRHFSFMKGTAPPSAATLGR